MSPSDRQTGAFCSGKSGPNDQVAQTQIGPSCRVWGRCELGIRKMEHRKM